MVRTAGHFTPKIIVKDHPTIVRVIIKVIDHHRRIIQIETVIEIIEVDDHLDMET